MGSVLTSAQIEELRQVDTATVTNALEHFDARPPTSGFASLELQCLMPELPPMVGYAVTCVGDSSSPKMDRKSQDRALYEALRDAPKPAVVVFQNIGIDRLRSNQFGDIMVTTFQRLGAVGAVTDGGIRDLAGMRKRAPGFQMFAAGAVPSAGVSIVVEVGLTVSICGLTIRPGELLHGDANGLISIPHEIADQVAAQGQEVLRKEQEKIDFIMSDDFSLERLIERQGW
jgi:regulator of RNase E activity RraA